MARAAPRAAAARQAPRPDSDRRALRARAPPAGRRARGCARCRGTSPGWRARARRRIRLPCRHAGGPARARAGAADAAAISSAFAFCIRASMARNQLLATNAARDWRAYSASSARRAVLPRAASRPARTRPHRSSSQLANTPAPSSPLESPLSVPPPRASEADLRIERGACHLDERRGLLDARRGDLQVGVICERLAHQRVELGSLNAASQRSPTAPATPAGAVQLAGTAKFGSACFASSSRSGGALSAQPASASASRRARARAAHRLSGA